MWASFVGLISFRVLGLPDLNKNYTCFCFPLSTSLCLLISCCIDSRLNFPKIRV